MKGNKESEMAAASENSGNERDGKIDLRRDAEETKLIAQKAQQSVVRCVKESNGLPKGGGIYELYASYPAFIKFMEEQEKRVLTLLQRTLKNAGFRIRFPKEIHDVEELLDTIIIANDRIFERTGILLDNLEKRGTEENNVIPRIEPGAESTFIQAPSRYSSLAVRANGVSGSSSSSLLHVSSSSVLIKKPQSVYSLPVDNSCAKFVPKLKVKHHALKDLKKNLRIVDDSEKESLEWANDQAEYLHPYQLELNHFVIPDEQLETSVEVPLRSVEETKLVMVDTVEKLKMLRDTLNEVSEFAVDLEHHDYRSFLGLTCLMQISTRTTDYIIDPFPIWNDMGILNEPFTNPKILKVFHGAVRDVLWLQRDFGIYIVNMFDTYYASEILNFARHNLAYIVSALCDTTLDKTLQKSDWRLRPLSEAHIEYARRDTHFLLHCYDKLRNLLLENGNQMKNLLHSVYDKSKLLCLKVYEKPVFESEGFEVIIKKSLNSQQRYALRALYKWRDERARTEDESINYVLPDHMLLKIAEVLPRELQGILACCYPVPPFVKQELYFLHHIIHEARDQPLIKPSLTAPTIAKLTFDSVVAQTSKMTKSKALLRCHLDFSSTKFDESIRTFNAAAYEKSNCSSDLERKDAVIDFEDFYTQEKFRIGESVSPEISAKSSKKVKEVFDALDQWATPYECYKIASEQEEAKEMERQKNEKKRAEEAKNEPKKLWTHHDPARDEKEPNVECSTQNEIKTAEEATTEEPSTSFKPFTEMVMTKKALKRKRQKEKRSVAIELSGSQKGPSPSKKSKQKNWTDAAEKIENAVRYEEYDTNRFYDKPKETNVYDPFRQTGQPDNAGKGKVFSKRFPRGLPKGRGGSKTRGSIKKH